MPNIQQSTGHICPCELKLIVITLYLPHSKLMQIVRVAEPFPIMLKQIKDLALFGVRVFAFEGAEVCVCASRPHGHLRQQVDLRN